jgi:hypothetical protein
MRAFAVATLAGLFAAGCEKPLQCTAEVNDGSGTQRATLYAERNELEPALRRRAVREACDKLCAKAGQATKACGARCSVDIEAGKLGGHVVCGKP